MDLTDRDAKVFYQLFIRYNEKSPNIGIIGNNIKYQRYIRQVLEEFKGTKARIIINNDKSVYRIILDEDIEYSYIHITNTNDLIGRTFRKFI